MKRLTTEEVKLRIQEVHGNKYDLSKVNYKNRRSKIEIVCTKHGRWLTLTEQLFRGQGCPVCGGKTVTKENSLELNFKSLISEWDFDKNKISPNEISYGSSKKVWWRCEKGHSFDMSPKTRTRKGMEQNCPYCSNRRIDNTNSIRILKPEWVNEWNFKKNKKYSPDNLGINSNFNVWWICKEGHEWSTSPNDRLSYDTGCPNCSISGYKTELPGYLYLHKIRVNEKYGFKYGITNYPKKRINHLRSRNIISKNKESEIENIFIFKGPGNLILDCEGKIRDTFGKSFFSKKEFPDGHTETLKFKRSTPLQIYKLLESEGVKIFTKKINLYWFWFRNFFNS